MFIGNELPEGAGNKKLQLIPLFSAEHVASSDHESFPTTESAAAGFFNDPIVHWYRNVFSHVPSTKVREIAAMLKAIHAGEDIAAARQKAVQVMEKLRGLRLTRAAELVETAVEETLAYYAFPEEHCRRNRTNNPLERILREIRRRTRVVGSFPDGQSALKLAAARLRHIAGTAWSTKRYLNVELLKHQQMTGAATA
jgi:putative transposase